MRVRNKFSTDRWKKNYWDWEVYLEETEDNALKIDDIKNVKYYLHTTFAQSILYSKDKMNKFQKMDKGWGEFLIGVEVETEKGEYYHSLYWLDLGFYHTKEEKKKYPGTFKKGPLTEEDIIEVTSN